jgi:predicted XRE-type DNA-binding protein
MPKRKIEFEIGSGNVFRDLGLKNPEELLAKAELASRIIGILDSRKLTQVKAARILGVDQPKVSMIYRGRLDDFSIERMMRFLNALGHDLRITVEAKTRRRRGRLIVEAA